MPVFVWKLKEFNDFLTDSAKAIGERGIVFHITGLSHSSPASISCRPRGKDEASTTAAILACINENLGAAAEGQTHNIPDKVLSSIECLAHPDPRKIVRAQVQFVVDGEQAESVYRFDDRFIERLGAAHDNEEEAIDTIDGKLEQVNIHNDANTFKIYAFISPVLCQFPQNLLNEVRGALESFVSVSGECAYRPHEAFLYKDLRGIAPGATGDKTPEQFVRALRDEWDKEAQ